MSAVDTAKRQVLVLEDEPLISMMLEEMLVELEVGVIGPVTSVSDGLAALQAFHQIDAALLDLELQGRESLPIANALAERGIPFAFVSGYEREKFAELGYSNIQILPKPFGILSLQAMLNQLLVRRTA